MGVPPSILLLRKVAEENNFNTAKLTNKPEIYMKA